MAIDLPRAQNGAEPQLLLTSLLGDFWYWREEHVPSAALIRLLAEFGITADGARAAMRRLAARGLLTVARTGRTTRYGIPERTAEVIVERTHRMLSFGATAPHWDGMWTVVAFSVPEHARDVRSALRAQLRVLRFAALFDGVWVCPHDRVDAAREVLSELAVTSATVLRATEPPGGPGPSGPTAAFDLEPLAKEYRAFVERYQPLLAQVEEGRIGPADALRLRTGLRVDWRRFPETDPALPAELLPAGWAGARAAALFGELHARWHDPAVRHWRALQGAVG
jgi:phenylacetic acid degradation operon negative regulatory protein